jgi:hypothetical protein
MGAAEAPAHTPWEDQKCLFLGHTGKNGGAIPVTPPDLNRLSEDKV